MKKVLSMLIILLIFISFIPSNVFAEEFPPEIAGEAVGQIIKDIIPAEPLTENEETDPEIPDIPQTPQKSADETAAEEFINIVNAIGDVSLSDEQAIVDALRAYASLSDLAKDMVSDAKAKLDAAMTVLGYLKAEEEKRLESENRIIAVTEALAAISDVTKEEGHTALATAIAVLEESYALLSDEEKLLLDERLVISEMPDYEAALSSAKELFTQWQKEYDESFLLPIKEKISYADNITPDEGIEVFENAINEITQMYSLLTDSQKTLFAEYDAQMKDLGNKLEAWENASDINTVISMLTQISETEKITPDDSELIYDTQRALEIITDKSMIPQELLGAFDSAVNSLQNAIADKAAAEDVIRLIDAIGNVTLNSEEAIANAKAAYDELTEDQKYYVTNDGILFASEAHLSLLKEEKIKADELILFIDSLGEMSLESEEAVKYARQIYDSLTEEGKEFVTNIDKLISAENIINDIKTAGEVEGLINNIGEVNIGKLSEIEDIREKYDALTDTQKALVTNLEVLENAEDVLKDHIAARKVEKIIDKLPNKASFTKDASIYSAKEAYDKLTADQKALVENGDKIISLYRSLQKMEAAVEEYLSGYGGESLYIDDTTGYVTVSADIHDFLTDEDKDLIAKGKMILYTVTVVAEEFTYEDADVTLLPIEEGEMPFSPFYHIYISRATADMDGGKVIFDDSEVTSVDRIPGEMTIEITVTEDMIPQVTDITRFFTGLISPLGNFGEFGRIMDTDQNMNTITFTTSSPVSIIPSFIDIINPTTGDSAVVYLIFGGFVVILIGIIALKKRNS